MNKSIYDQRYFEGTTKRGGRNVANEFFQRFLFKQNIKKGSLLEIGCAKGEFLRLVEDDFESLVGIDISEYAISQSKSRVKKAATYLWDIENSSTPPFSSGPFDVISSMHTFEHFHSPQRVLQNLRPLLKSDGVMVVLVPNPLALKLRLVRFFDRKNRFYIFDDKTHYSMHDRKTWTRLLSDSGFDVTSYGRPFFYFKHRALVTLYGDRYYHQGFACETGPELIFVCRKRPA